MAYVFPTVDRVLVGLSQEVSVGLDIGLFLTKGFMQANFIFKKSIVVKEPQWISNAGIFDLKILHSAELLG